MTIYHLSIKTISRAQGRSATAAAAYRAGVEITDERTGDNHDYRRKSGIESAVLILPRNSPKWAKDRAVLWNAAEAAEKRKNSTVAREFEIALPSEMKAAEREKLAYDFARELVERHQCAADVAIHAPSREGDNRNHHAHILLTTRRLGANGFTEKTRELDVKTSGEIMYWRKRFADLQNERLQIAGIAARVDYRTLEEQGINREPTQHLGPTATAIERRTKQPSQKRMNQLQETREKQALAREERGLVRENKKMEDVISSLSASLQEAKQEQQQDILIEEGIQNIWNNFEQHEREQAIEITKKKELEAQRKAEARQNKKRSGYRR